MTSMVLASAYLGGAYFFLRVLVERHWNAIKIGFPPVILFAGLLGVATVMHWDVFNHRHATFWIWAALYFTTPFLVLWAWLANRRIAGSPLADELRLGPQARLIIGMIGLLALVQGLIMFVAPQLVMPFWPWSLTPSPAGWSARSSAWAAPASAYSPILDGAWSRCCSRSR